VCAWLGVAGVIGLCGCRSQSPTSRGISTVKVRDIDSYIELVARQREREQASKAGTGRTYSKETIFEERVGLETDGYVYHPNLLEFTLGGVFGLIQEEFVDTYGGDLQSSRDSGKLVEFNLDAQILQKKKYPASVFTHRRRSLTPRAFMPSLETTTTDYGFTWRYVSQKVPTRLQFNHSESRMSPLFLAGGVERDGRRDNTLWRFETGYVFNEDSKLTLLYERESVEEEPYELNYDSDEVTLSHRLAFGKENRHTLDSDLNYLDREGTSNLERFRWREILHMRHTEKLQSSCRLEAWDQTYGTRSAEFPAIEERRYLFAASLRHQLYDSLTSNFSGFLQNQKFEPGLEIDGFGAEATFTYHKKNRWGALTGSYGASIRQDDHSGDVQQVEILEELHVFSDPEPITLSNSNVRTSSIVIRADDRVTFYRVGQDYTVHQIGDQTEIRRMPTGRIDNGQTVVIDYVYSFGGTFKLDTVGQTFRIRQDFDFGLAPYYRLNWQDQTISPRGATGTVEDDITAHIFGVEFRKASLRLSAEYEDRDSTIDPFEAIRLDASYTHRFKIGATASVGASWSDVNHLAPNERQVRLFTLDSRCRWQVTPTMAVEGTALYRLGEDTATTDDEGLDLFFSLEWAVRQTEVRLTYEYTQFEDDYTDGDSSAFYVRVKRSF
jgi:hypothetical protein